VPLGTGNDSLLEQSLVSAKNHWEDDEKQAKQENRYSDNGYKRQVHPSHPPFLMAILRADAQLPCQRQL
jgi:hypothetical protein